MHWENALDPFAVRNAPNRKRFVQAPSFSPDDDTSEDLNAFFVAFDDSSMDANGIADPECLYLGLELFFLDGVDDAVHDR